MKKLMTIALAGLLVGMAEANIISFNFNQSGVPITDITGDYGVIAEDSVTSGWINDFNPNGDTITFNNGSASTVSFTAVRPNGNNKDSSGDSDNYDNTPMRGFAQAYLAGGAEVHLTAANLNANFADGYKVIAYLGGQSGNTDADVSLTLGSAADYDAGTNTTTYDYRTRFNPDATGDAGFHGINDSRVGIADADSTSTTVAEYAVFDNLSADTFTLTINGDAGGPAGLGGIQIVAIPEPATLGFMGIAGSGLLFLRKRFGSNS